LDQEERGRGRDGMDLTAQLDDPDPAIRRWAARDLAMYPGAVAVLLAHLAVERDLSVREVMLTTLVRLNDPAAVAYLVGFLRSEDAALRNEAVETLKELPDHVAAIIRELLSDKSPDVRIFGVNVLESLRHPDVEKWLVETIEIDPHVNVCATAVDLLAEVGTEHSRQPLERLKKRFPNVPYLAFAIDIASSRIART
jgi:HEAT repeat protein